MSNNKNSDYRELYFSSMSHCNFDVYCTALCTEAVNSTDHLDFMNCLANEIVSRNHTDDVFRFSGCAFAVEHKENNTDAFSFVFNNDNYIIKKKTVRCTCSDNDYKETIVVDAEHIRQICGMHTILQAKSWSLPSFYDVLPDALLSENDDKYDVYCVKDGRPNMIHERYGGNCVKDFADQLSEIIRDKNEAPRLFSVGAFDFAISHKETNLSGFILDYGGIVYRIEKKTIEISS